MNIFKLSQDIVHHDEPTTPNLKTRKVLPSDTVGTTYTTEDGEFLILGLIFLLSLVYTYILNL